MKSIRNSLISTHRDSWVEINLTNIEHNVKEVKKYLDKDMKLFAVVKADAYGHGAAMIAPTLLASGVDMLGVASIDEALNLREATDAEIFVLGAVPLWALNTAIENNISITIFSQEHLDACKQISEREGKPIKAHIKINTGMNRIGAEPKNAVEFIKKAQKASYIDLKGIFTHLYCAENQAMTDKQFELWNGIISKIDTEGLLLHILNTSGIFCHKCPSNMARCGIALYGLCPDLTPTFTGKIDLKQAMSVKTRIINIHTVEKGDGISYNHTYIADKKTTIATVPIGYADGIPRALSNKIYGHINGQKIKQVGNITMDQMMFDVTGLDVKDGDVITLLDESLPIDDWAKLLNTIHYELTCRLKMRLTRVYTR